MKNRTDIITHIVEKYGAKTYLEIGVRNGKENFNLIKVEDKDGVDPAPVTPVNYQMTSDEFFNNHAKDKIYDVIFVDGLHTGTQVYKDVMNAINYLNPNGFIILHDCNPPTEYHARSYDEYLKSRGEWNGDVFKGFIKLKKELVNWNCFVVDEDFGCGVITKNGLNGVIHKLLDIPESIDWEYFNNNRVDLLSLVSYNNFIKII